MMPFKIDMTGILYTVLTLVRCWESSLVMSSVNEFRQ